MLGLIKSLGLGEQLMVAAVFGIIFLYLLKGRKIAKVLAGIVGTAWFAASVIVASAAVAIGAGWVDPNPAEFIGDLVAAGNAFFEMVGQRIVDMLERRF